MFGVVVALLTMRRLTDRAEVVVFFVVRRRTRHREYGDGEDRRTLQGAFYESTLTLSRSHEPTPLSSLRFVAGPAGDLGRAGAVGVDHEELVAAAANRPLEHDLLAVW